MLSHFLLALTLAFFCYLPFGTVNMVVLNTAIVRALRPAVLIAVGSALVEIFYTFVAITLTQWLGRRLIDNIYIDFAALILLFGVGLYFWFSSPRAQKESQSSQRTWGFLGTGIVFGLINPQGLPFITLALAYVQSQDWVFLQDASNCLGLMLGVAAGRFLSLLLYAYAGQWLSSQLQQLSQWANKVTGGILLLLGSYQAIRVLIELY
uniref:LysE family transporter n=1 Tax=Roseihalotalea indica TaxID=2867963 RepID=A0AA49GR17_9BACT|nr:LysE family transporter [Tunicatimonas sp. TK19036]